MDPRDRRTALSYDDALAQTAQDVAVREGTSGYFSTPVDTLDPKLFQGLILKPSVRKWLIDTLYSFWGSRGYLYPGHWAHIWLAGSGITYQWAAQRDPGDLDCLVGLNARVFMHNNPRFAGLSEADLAEFLNTEMKTLLWPTTAHWQGFEVTFYINPGGQDIRSIHPYAAYDVSQGHWTVPPPKDGDYASQRAFSPAFQQAVHDEDIRGRGIIENYSQAVHAAINATNVATRRNAEVRLAQVVSEGASLFNDIHLGRHNAFGPDGAGYADYYNFRWQTHKRSGLVPALAALAKLKAETGEHIDSGAQALRSIITRGLG